MTLLGRLKVALSQFDGVLTSAVNENHPRIPHIVGSVKDPVQRAQWFRVQKKIIETGIREIEGGKPITPFMQMLYECTASTIMSISKRLLQADADGGNCNARSTLTGDWGRGHAWSTKTEDDDDVTDILTNEMSNVRKREVRLVGARDDWDVMFERMWKGVLNKERGKAASKKMLARYTIDRWGEFLKSLEGDWIPYWQSLNAMGKGHYIMGMERFISEEVWKVTPSDHYKLRGPRATMNPETYQKGAEEKFKRKYDSAQTEVVEDFDLEGGIETL